MEITGLSVMVVGLGEEVRVLDHYILGLVNNCYGVVVGNMHSNSYVLGYIKYCPSRETTIWSDNNYYYARLVDTYSASKVYSVNPWKTYIPYYDQYIPVIPYSLIKKIYDPVKRVWEIISSPQDSLEKLVVEMIDYLMDTGVYRGLGLTGSLLPRIHSVRYSDIDLVVYGWREAVEVIEYVSENPGIFKSFNESLLRKWGLRVAVSTGLSYRDVVKHYRVWRRGVFRDREYSIIYNDMMYRSLDNSIYWKTIGSAKLYIELAGGFEALNYPSRSNIDHWRLVEGVEPRSDVEYILSFEALYIPVLYEGGRVETYGLLQHDQLNDRYRLLIGVREKPTYIRIIG